MRYQIKLTLSIFIGILLVYGAISYMVMEIEESHHEQLLFANHHFLAGEITRFLEEEELSKEKFREKIMRILEMKDLQGVLDHSLIATRAGEPILGNGSLYHRLQEQSVHYQVIVNILPNDWILLTQIPHATFPLLNRNIWLIIFSLSMLIGVTLVLYRIIRSILAGPLEKLTEVTHSLVQGHGQVEDFEISANTEMRVLAREIFALREKLESVSTASRKFEEILSVSYLEKMDLEEFTLSVFETLSNFIDSEGLHLYIYDQDQVKKIYSYPEKPIACTRNSELEIILASTGEIAEGEQFYAGAKCDLYLYPLQTPKGFLGYLLITFAPGHQLRPKDREIIRFVRTRLVYATINTNYFERLEAEKEKLHIHSSKMELMVILANELREVEDLFELYQAVCQKICDYFGFNMAYLLRYNPGENGYRCFGFFSWGTDLRLRDLRATLLTGQTMTQSLKEIYRTGREMRIKDIPNALGRDQQIYEEFLGGVYPEEAVLVPVFRNRKVEGVLALDVTGIVLDPALMGLLKIFSQIVGEEIARLDLLQEREQYVRELEIERKRLKENIGELERTKEALAAERFKRLKDNLITEFSHDMRTPLTILAGYLDLLRKNVFDPEVMEKIIQTMQEETTHLISMVENLLESAKILSDGESQRLVTMIELDHWLHHLIQANPLYRERVQLEVVGEVTLELATDEGKLTKIITNLIDNACKYSQGQVDVQIKGEDGEPVILVQDYGIGIEKEVLHCIFRKFYRVKNAKTRGTRGSGLGLFIVKEYTEQLGGKVEVESTPGQGTTFLLRFPDVNSQGASEGERVCKEYVS